MVTSTELFLIFDFLKATGVWTLVGVGAFLAYRIVRDDR